jgi:hypothetical protein
MKNLWIRSGILAATYFAASTAFGNAFAGPNPDTQNLTWGGFSNGSVGVSVSTNSGTSYSSVNTGQFYGFFDGEGNGLGADDFFRFFCIELGQFVDSAPNPYTRTLGVDGAHNATDAAELTRLFDQFYPNGATGTYYSGGSQTNFGNFANATDSAAFQLAIWEIWFDTDNALNLSSGSFRAGSSAVTTQAQGYLTAIGNGSTPADGWTLYEFNSPSKQDYLSVTNTGPLQQTPEPGTLILLGVGALAAWGTSKRHRKTA